MLQTRQTKQRIAILEAMRSNSLDHPSAAEVYSSIRKSFPKISLGTIYRNLNFLCSKGEILKIEIPNAPDRYDHRISEHSHIFCSKCGRLFDIPGEFSVLDFAEKVERGGFILHSLTVTARGVCSECRRLGESALECRPRKSAGRKILPIKPSKKGKI